MECTGISHIAVCVRDMDKSLAFYRDILGMTISKDAIEDTSLAILFFLFKLLRIYACFGGGLDVSGR